MVPLNIKTQFSLFAIYICSVSRQNAYSKRSLDSGAIHIKPELVGRRSRPTNSGFIWIIFASGDCPDSPDRALFLVSGVTREI
jgi:hypothetical protein